MTSDVKGIVAKTLAVLNKTNTFSLIQNFTSGIHLGGTPGFNYDPVAYAPQRLLTIDFGYYSNYTSGVGDIIYGFASDVKRSAGSSFTVAAQFSAYANNSSVSGACFGLVTQAWNRPGAATDLAGGELAIINETSSLVSNKVGLNVVFKDRADGQAAILGTLGTNGYNWNSKAIWITSQTRSTVTEYCGWRFGIHFDIDALDRDASGTAIGIDFASVRYLGVPDPLLAYRMTAAIRFRDFQSILWNGDPTLSGNPTDPANPIRTYFDSIETHFVFSNTAVKVLRVNMANGDTILKNGSKLFLDGSTNAANLQYDATNTRFAFDNGGTHQFAVDVANGGVYMRHGGKLMFEGSGSGAYLQADVAQPGTLGLVNAIFVSANGISFLNTFVQGTVGAAGGASALPATPSHYIKIFIEGAPFVFPVYAVS